MECNKHDYDSLNYRNSANTRIRKITVKSAGIDSLVRLHCPHADTNRGATARGPPHKPTGQLREQSTRHYAADSSCCPAAHTPLYRSRRHLCGRMRQQTRQCAALATTINRPYIQGGGVVVDAGDGVLLPSRAKNTEVRRMSKV